jgi:ATP-dependent 26S proteasome regulatory subunit
MPKKTPKQLITSILEDKLPIEHRAHILARICMEGGDDNHEVIGSILKAAASGGGQMIYEQKIAEMNERLEELEQGPLRMATFRRMLEGGRVCERASVMLEDGSSAFVTVPETELAKTLRRGDSVLVDAQGKAVLFRDPHGPETGEIAGFERRLDAGRIEVTLRGHERSVYWISAGLAERLDADEVGPGRMLIVCSRRRMAFDVLPVEDGLAHYVYLAREPVPELSLADIGAPPSYVTELIDLVGLEMTNPELRRRYRLYRSVMKVLAGPTGTGKSYSIYALWHELYQMMSKVTGVPVAELPPRVIRLRMPEVLSRWLGDSDKNLDRFFSEVEQLAGDPLVAPDGREYTLPALCILEEIDGVARARGQEPIYDRILTTALQRLDTTRPELRDKLILFVATTNVPQQVDAAFLRRVGGTIEHFGRLGRSEFVAVLDKQLSDRPVAVTNGVGATGARDRLIAAVTAWLYGPSRADTVQVELTYAGAASGVPKYRRDFMTPSVVDRAMQMASWNASLVEHRGETDAPGLTSELLIAALDQQVRGIVETLHEQNVHDYLDLPEGVRVASLRRPRQSSIHPVQLETIH